MDDPSDLTKYLPGGPVGTAIGAMLGIAYGAYRLVRSNSSKDAVNRADDAGKIDAINEWKDIAGQQSAGRKEAEARADNFAKERNDALQKMGEMQGQLKLMGEQLDRQSQQLRDQAEQLGRQAEQLTRQSQEISSLRDALAQLKGK